MDYSRALGIPELVRLILVDHWGNSFKKWDNCTYTATVNNNNNAILG